MKAGGGHFENSLGSKKYPQLRFLRAVFNTISNNFNNVKTARLSRLKATQLFLSEW